MLIARLTRQFRTSARPHAANVWQLRQYANLGTDASTPQAQDTTLTNDGTRTLRKRENGGRALPLPPLMDPVAVKAKSRYKQRKALPSKRDAGKTEFQRELEANPYAQALATPVRVCGITSAHLPSHFLLPLVSHLEPPSTTDEPKTSDRPPKHPKAHLVPDIGLRVPLDLRCQARSYVLAQQHILGYMSSKRRTWAMAVTERMKRWFGLKTDRRSHNLKLQNEWLWDEATPQKVLGKLRESVVEKLARALERGEVSVIQPCEQTTAAHTVQSVACFLRLGYTEEQDMEAEDAIKRDLDVASGQGVRIYGLAHMLGQEALQGLCESPGLADSENGRWVAVPRSSHTVELQLALLRLNAYITEPAI